MLIQTANSATNEISRSGAEAGVSGAAVDDRALVERARREPQAFSAIYRRHYAAVVGYIFRRTGDVHGAEDLAADTFIAAFRALPRYRITRAPLLHWLLRIATNKTNRWAKNRRRARLLPAVLAAAAPQPATRGAPADDSDSREILGALARLSPDHQAVIALHYFEGLSVEHVAEVLGQRVGTVKSRLGRARAALRSLLNPGTAGGGAS